MKIRITCDLLLLTSVFCFPWWVTIALAIIFLFIFESFWEVAVAGILLDVLYSFESAFSLHSLKYSIFFICLFALSLPVKNCLKFYSLKR